MRHSLAWLSNTRPELLASVNILAQVTETRFSKEAIRDINAVIHTAHDSAQQKPNFQPLKIPTSHIFLYTGASYATNYDSTYQLGSTIFLHDDTVKANLLSYSSVKSKLVARSALYTETIGLAVVINEAAIMR